MFVKFSCHFISDLLEKILSSSQPLIKFAVSSHRVFVEKGTRLLGINLIGTRLFSNILSLIFWSEICFKTLALAHFFNCLLNTNLFFFA